MKQSDKFLTVFYIFIIVLEILMCIKTKDLLHLSIIIWIVNSIVLLKANTARETFYEECIERRNNFIKQLIEQNKENLEDSYETIAHLGEQNKFLEKIVFEKNRKFKAKKRWKI